MTNLFRRITLVFLCSFVWMAVSAQDPGPTDEEGNDVLAYKDGDRVQGKLVEQTADTIVFSSEKFGVLRVPVAKAVVIRATREPQPAQAAAKPAPTLEPKPAAKVAAQPAPAPAPAAKSSRPSAPPATAVENLQTAAEPSDSPAVEKVSRWEWFSPAVLTAKLASLFGPWHGKIAFSTEVVSDSSERNNLSLDTQLRRKWKSDEVQLKARYDYSKTNQLTTTDMIKADALWRHDFTKNRFALYRPTLEWNRANFISRLPADYILLQQEIGVGLTLFSKPSRKVRVGVSENLFDVWNTVAPTSHDSRTVESAFVETEFRLPWRMSLSQRSVYYYSFASGTDGWENRIELAKKFTETLSTSIRHEIRRDNPDGRAPDYTRLRLLFGLDF